jgi:hypothetical protein
MTLTELYTAIDNQLAEQEFANDATDIDFDVLDHDLDVDIDKLLLEEMAVRKEISLNELISTNV